MGESILGTDLVGGRFSGEGGRTGEDSWAWRAKSKTGKESPVSNPIPAKIPTTRLADGIAQQVDKLLDGSILEPFATILELFLESDGSILHALMGFLRPTHNKKVF